MVKLFRMIFILGLIRVWFTTSWLKAVFSTGPFDRVTHPTRKEKISFSTGQKVGLVKPDST
jgi:hypothetical protein